MSNTQQKNRKTQFKLNLKCDNNPVIINKQKTNELPKALRGTPKIEQDVTSN